jgi:hypothetical protein
MVQYCELCKKTHCGKDATYLFSEDKVRWSILNPDGSEIILLCDTHKRIFEGIAKRMKLKPVFIKLKQSPSSVKGKLNGDGLNGL